MNMLKQHRQVFTATSVLRLKMKNVGPTVRETHNNQFWIT